MSSQQKTAAKLTVAALSSAMLASTATMALPALKAEAQTTTQSNTVKTTNTSRLGQIKYSTALIYKTPNSSLGTKAGTSKLQLTYYINKTAKYKNVTYYQISNYYNSTTKPAIGWIKAQYLNSYAYTVNKNTTSRYITGSGKGYTRPWGGSRNVLFSSLTAYKGALFKTKTIEKVGNETWYSGTLNGQTIWLKSNQVTTKNPAITVNKLGRIKTATAKVYSDINNLTKQSQATSTKVGKTYYITKQVTIGTSTYYQLSGIGWVKSTDVTAVARATAQKPSAKQVLNGTGSGYSIPWGTTKNITLKTLKKDEAFTIKTATKAGTETWYQGTTANNTTIWVSSKQVENYVAPEKPVEPTVPVEPTQPIEPTKPTEPPAQQPETTAITKVGTLKSTTTKIYQDLTDLTKTIDAGTAFTKENFYVYKQATVDNKTYYQISRANGTKVGWVEKDQITLSDITSSTTANLKLYLTGFGTAYNISNGTTNNVVYSSLANYRAKAFTANKIEVINGKTFYQGSIGGKTVWITPEQTGNDYLVENLRKTSNITIKEMQDYLIKVKGQSYTSNALYKLVPTFFEIQKEYGINVQFLVAHAIVESGWGNPKLSQVGYYKHNFFGYQAYDSAALTCALYFPTEKAGLEYYADRIYNNYLKQGGRYNNGVNVAGMNVMYASDINWGRSISRLMEGMKPYDSKYYAAQPLSTLNPAPLNVTYDNIIPADQPQPDSFLTFDKGVTATANLLTPVYSMPYATTSRQIGTLALGHQITILGHNLDVWDYEDSKGKLIGRWFRVSFNGNDQAWVRSDYLNIKNLAVTNGDGCNVRDKATTKDSNILTKLNKDTYMKLVTDSSGKVVTAKDENNTTWYQVYIPGKTTKAWISSTIVTKF